MAERRLHGLQRVLGVNALFSTAYGNVGSSIYYALGLVASFALGLTPVVFLIAGGDLLPDGRHVRRGDGDVPGGGRLELVRPARLQRVLVVLRRVGPDAQLRHHDRHLGVLRAALLRRRRSASTRCATARRHLRRHRRDRAAGGGQRARRGGVGAASTSAWRSPTSRTQLLLVARRPVPGLLARDAGRQRPLGHRADVEGLLRGDPGRR